MSQGICNNHGQIEAVWKEGVSKAGKKYAFWSCPNSTKLPDGTWQKCLVKVANTPSGKFEQDLDKSGVAIDKAKKDDIITKLAIVKSMIERGEKWSLEAIVECERWLSWVEGRQAPVTPPPTEEVPLIVDYDDLQQMKYN